MSKERKISILNKVIYKQEFELFQALQKMDWTLGQSLVIKHSFEYYNREQHTSSVEMLKVLLASL